MIMRKFVSKLVVLILLMNTFRSVDLSFVVVNTWNFSKATESAINAICASHANNQGDMRKVLETLLDGVVAGGTYCEEHQCDGTVGFGGSPDESGETTLDAMVMDGTTFNVGAVANLRRIKSAMKVAREVYSRTEHSILAGDQATQFAMEMGFKQESLTTNASQKMWDDWKLNQCQPNYWENVTPEPSRNCGPYRQTAIRESNHVSESKNGRKYGERDHDTIGLVAVHVPSGQVVSGTSTNGMNHKIAGRVGDSPIPGAGSYAHSGVGGATSTGDGDVMLRFLPSFLAVELMKQQPQMSPQRAARMAIRRIVRDGGYTAFSGAVVVVSSTGAYGAACHNIRPAFPFSVMKSGDVKATLRYVKCTSS